MEGEGEWGVYVLDEERKEVLNIERNVVIDGVGVDGRIGKVGGEEDGR